MQPTRLVATFGPMQIFRAKPDYFNYDGCVAALAPSSPLLPQPRVASLSQYSNIVLPPGAERFLSHAAALAACLAR